MVGLGLQTFKDAAQPVLLGKHTGSPELRARSEGGDLAVLVDPGRTSAEESVQTPVHAQGHGVPAAPGRGHAARKATATPYTLRARPEPAVSTPVTWEEVADCRDPGQLALRAGDLESRLQAYGDLLAPLLDPGAAWSLP